jgi:hypothetical protein
MNDIVKHIAGTYKALRLLLFLVGFSLPLILMIGGKTSAAHIPWATHSMSAYYHLNDMSFEDDSGKYIYREPKALGVMRNWFVGGLFAIGVLLIAYKGIRRFEDWVLNIAGIMAVGVAINPMDWPIKNEQTGISLHGFCAVSVFLCIAYVCICRSWDTVTEELIPSDAKRKFYKVVYQILGWLMGLLPFFAWASGSANHRTFWIEASGVWVFAFYWLVKTVELWGFEEMVMRGEIDVPKLKSKMDLFRQVPVAKKAP